MMSFGYKSWNEDSQLPILSTRTKSLAIEFLPSKGKVVAKTQCHFLGHHVNAD